MDWDTCASGIHVSLLLCPPRPSFFTLVFTGSGKLNSDERPRNHIQVVQGSDLSIGAGWRAAPPESGGGYRRVEVGVAAAESVRYPRRMGGWRLWAGEWVSWEDMQRCLRLALPPLSIHAPRTTPAVIPQKNNEFQPERMNWRLSPHGPPTSVGSWNRRPLLSRTRGIPQLMRKQHFLGSDAAQGDSGEQRTTVACCGCMFRSPVVHQQFAHSPLDGA